MLSPEQTKQFNEIFAELGKSLDITQAQYEAAVKSYEFVGQWLSRPESLLAPYNPEILPQGSFLFGTMVRPIHEDDDFDVDLVCRLEGKNQSWTQYDLKKIVGDRLKQHETFKRMLEKEGRRCWTLAHRDDAKFHMDILPAIVNTNFKVILNKSMSAQDTTNVEDLAIRITDKLMANYFTSPNPPEWLKSNPFGYAVWFRLRASVDIYKSFSLREAVQPVPAYQIEKLPLQVVVQILKRHRDIMFNGDDDKPISIIITTLAAKAYNRQTNILDALESIVNTMHNFIEERYDSKSGRYIKWIANPVNPEENFADKWPANPKKQDNFYKWLQHLKTDVDNIKAKRGMNYIQEALVGAFGKREVNSVFSEIGERARKLRESGGMKMAANTGLLGTTGRTTIPNHTNFGKNE